MGTAIVVQVEQVQVVPPPYGPWPVKLGARELLLAKKAYELEKNAQPVALDEKT